MNYKIYFGLERDDYELEDKYIDSWEFTADLESIYTSAKLTLKDFTRTYFNQIQNGMDIFFKFYDGDYPSNSQKVYTNKMKVLSFDKIPAPQSIFNDTTNFTLVNSLYFTDDTPDTKSYEGTVYTITQKVLSEYSDLKKELSITDDPTAFRYQNGDTPIKFLKRISKFGLKEGLPVYLFMDATNTMKLKGIHELINSSTFYTAEPMLSQEVASYSSSDKSSNKIILTNYRFDSDGLNASSSITTFFETENFISNNEFYSKSTFNNTENNNIQTAALTPSSINFLNWNLNPYDAYNLSRREGFEKSMRTYHLVATTPGIKVEGIHPGSLIKVVLPYDTINVGGKERNLGEGEYLVKRVRYIFDGTNPYTQMSLIQANY